ncbi:MAG: hypothetical protein ABIP85_03135 [Chthoniobacteraceae bacterium]
MKKGKRQIIQLLNRNVVASVTMMRVLQIACYAASLLVLVVSVWILIRSELTAAQVVFGLLATSLGPLFFVGIGLLLPMVTKAEQVEVE